jgi:hypothetical protein
MDVSRFLKKIKLDKGVINMKENILMLLTLEEISNITKGLKLTIEAVKNDNVEIDEKLEDDIEEVLKKLLQVEAECSR